MGQPRNTYCFSAVNYRFVRKYNDYCPDKDDAHPPNRGGVNCRIVTSFFHYVNVGADVTQ
jgi:hypothetical protein